MKNLHLTILVALIFSAQIAFSQSSEITVRFIGNCGLHITDGDLNLYVDFPYKSGAHHYMEYDKSEIDNISENPVFLFTHKHSDHYSKKLLKKKDGKKFGPWNIAELEKFSESVPDFSIDAFKTKHRFSFSHYSYLISWHGKKIFISGDTGNADTLGKQEGMDWAFVPAWIFSDATEKNLKIDTEMFGLYHIGPRDQISSESPKILLMDKQGEVICIPY